MQMRFQDYESWDYRKPSSNGCSILIRPSVGRSSETLLVKLPTRLQQPNGLASQLKTGELNFSRANPLEMERGVGSASRLERTARSPSSALGDFQHVGILVDIGNGFPVHFRSSVSHA